MGLFVKNGKWEWPIAKKIKNYYNEHGLIRTILYVILILLGIKIFIINGIIFLLRNLFGLDIPFGPILRLFGVEIDI
tara:strand:- start:974 stop:1204 length:231 start_codon:yes stop_codon:yes gene_type:complete